jgi:starch phosphorylase
VWLNNPRRPLEASGTSGQKVVLNGGLNLSVLDGWWAEAYDGLNGFAIGTGRTHTSVDLHDARDREDLYRVLREEVIPLYYQRDRDGLPHGWIKRMKRTIRTLGWRFNADRMVMDYTLKCYVPAAGGTSSDMGPTHWGCLMLPRRNLPRSDRDTIIGGIWLPFLRNALWIIQHSP